MIFINIATFMLLQTSAMLVLRWGSLPEGTWWIGFTGGNLLGISSTVFMMKLYRDLPPSLTITICIGGAFLVNQITIAIISNNNLSPAQWTGVALMVLGIFLLSQQNIVQVYQTYN